MSKINKEIFKRIPDIADRAYLVAWVFHNGQFRRDGKTPYFTHLDAVAKKFVAPSIIAVAYLHDALEDVDYTGLTMTDLGHVFEFPKIVVDAVQAITKQKWETYEDYLLRVNNNLLARLVKIEDIRHNNSDSPTDRQKQKYKKAFAILNSKK